MVARIVNARKVSLVIVRRHFSLLLEIVPFAREGRLAVRGGVVTCLLVRELPSTSLIQKEIEFYAYPSRFAPEQDPATRLTSWSDWVCWSIKSGTGVRIRHSSGG
jgi:hypothetical protein